MILMPERQTSLRINLAHAHAWAYESDAEPDHLRAAQTLLTDQIADPG